MPNTSKIYAVCKRTLDIILALIGLIMLSPGFIILSIFYLYGENKGPLIFKQKRVGKNGKVFFIYKFRSMVVDADKKLKENKILYQKYIKNNYKLEQEEDPRITKLGGFLRKTSLDEIPQLINVLKGDMSLVGPRPVVEEELKEYGAKVNSFLSVKPGVTGYWQVSGRSNVGYPERVDIELYYVKNQTFRLDLTILVKTIFMVILRKGAY
ncbi:sugar transferase [Heyndrickxia coagulans]|uniref:sugar transferase n=1 Tax=Heyndrickxia coagulans TaxID=1398 RepID=UPI002E248736|nr:sugar transferase [Heyndrickxia coagulans]